MDLGIRYILISFLLLFQFELKSQMNVTTLGVQFKPMFTSRFFGTGPEQAESRDLSVTLTPRFGMNLGMVVRRGITKNWSFESGICFVQRNYRLDFAYPELDEVQELNFRFIGYEIPLQGMVYVRLGEQLYMNASAGMSIDMYPTDIGNQTDTRRDSINYDFFMDTFRKNWVQVSVLANYGFEYRTKDQGFFYVGGSFHRPFNAIATTQVRMERETFPTRTEFELSGTYLTIDFRYFFHEDPERRKVKTKKASP